MMLNQATVGLVSAGHVVNLASNDAQRFDQVGILQCTIVPPDLTKCTVFALGLHICSSVMARSTSSCCVYLPSVCKVQCRAS